MSIHKNFKDIMYCLDLVRSKCETRKLLNGIFFKIYEDNETIQLVATNGKILFKANMILEFFEKSFELFYDKEFTTKNEGILFLDAKSREMFDLNSMFYFEEEYPKFENVIPKNFDSINFSVNDQGFSIDVLKVVDKINKKIYSGKTQSSKALFFPKEKNKLFLFNDPRECDNNCLLLAMPLAIDEEEEVVESLDISKYLDER